MGIFFCLLSFTESMCSLQNNPFSWNINIDKFTLTRLFRFMIMSQLSWFNRNSQTNEKEIERFEDAMFKNIQTPIKRSYVTLHSNLQIWTLSVNTHLTSVPLVLIHGLCGGIALWAQNIDELCQSRPLFAFDLLGFGKSSRPSFSLDP